MKLFSRRNITIFLLILFIFIGVGSYYLPQYYLYRVYRKDEERIALEAAEAKSKKYIPRFAVERSDIKDESIFDNATVIDGSNIPNDNKCRSYSYLYKETRPQYKIINKKASKEPEEYIYTISRIGFTSYSVPDQKYLENYKPYSNGKYEYKLIKIEEVEANFKNCSFPLSI